jgi:hypothetical protein
VSSLSYSHTYPLPLTGIPFVVEDNHSPVPMKCAERDCRKCGDRQHFNHRHRGNVNSPIDRLPTRRIHIGNDKPFICLLEFNAGSLPSFSSHRYRQVTYSILLTYCQRGTYNTCHLIESSENHNDGLLRTRQNRPRSTSGSIQSEKPTDLDKTTMF